MQLGKNMERKNLTAMRVTGNFQVKIAPGKIRRRMRHQQAVSSLSGFGKSAVQVGRFAIGRSGKSIGNAGEIKVFADGRAVVFQKHKAQISQFADSFVITGVKLMVSGHEIYPFRRF